VGELLLDGEDMLAMDVVSLRRRVGMVFQKSNPFPKSIFDNVAYGLRINGWLRHHSLAESVERSLRRAALWDEVKDQLHDSAYALSGGPAAAPVHRPGAGRGSRGPPSRRTLLRLDPIATAKIEELMFTLKDTCTLLIVTHNMQQAARVAEHTGFFLMGKLIEFDRTEVIFKRPARKETEDYITGRFG